jgi:hypothetical protein
MRKQRALAGTIALVALALSVMGVVIAAIDPNPGGLAKDPLVLNGYPPKTVQIAVAISTGSDVTLNATLEANFRTERVAALVHVPVVVTSASLNLVWAKGTLYARSADVENGPWFQTSQSMPDLFGLSLEFTKPDINLVGGFHKTVSRSGYTTTYVFTKNDVALTSLLAPSGSLSVLGSVRWTISVGSQGEVSASTLVEKTRHAETTISATVLSYDQPAPIQVPPTSATQSLSHSGVAGILKDVNFNSLLVPSALRSLGQTSIS